MCKALIIHTVSNLVKSRLKTLPIKNLNRRGISGTIPVFFKLDIFFSQHGAPFTTENQC